MSVSGKQNDEWNISLDPKLRDLLLGTLCGFCSGMLFCRVGKISAAALTGGFFIVRVMEQKGYVAINWEKVSQDFQLSAKRLQTSDNGVFSRVKKVVNTYKYFVTGYSGGFIIGLGLN